MTGFMIMKAERKMTGLLSFIFFENSCILHLLLEDRRAASFSPFAFHIRPGNIEANLRQQCCKLFLDGVHACGEIQAAVCADLVPDFTRCL